MGDMAELYDYWMDRYDEELDLNRPATCKYCGEGDLWWKPEDGRRYRLMAQDGTQHICRRPIEVDEVADEFDNIESED